MPIGEVAEWPIVQHWKCCVLERGPGVRIPPSPLRFGHPAQVPVFKELAMVSFFGTVNCARNCAKTWQFSGDDLTNLFHRGVLLV